MTNAKTFCGYSLAVAGALVSLALAWPNTLLAQSQGNSVVYNSTPALTYSTAYLDASAFATGQGFCAIVGTALGKLPSGGGVLDARGINSSNSTMKCAGSTPWSALTSAVPALILLPAGTIQTNTSWIVPNGTKLVGLGPGVTVIEADASISAAILQMGYTGTPTSPKYNFAPCGTSNVCNGIGIESLTVAANGNTVSYGIENTNSQELSYVKHVDLKGMTGTGLYVASGGQNSGPYSDITVTMASSTPECAQISQVNTRGIHGMNCTGDTTGTGIYLDGSNNTIEDVHFSELSYGIQVGVNENAQSNVLLNITGDSTVSTIIHLSTSNTVTDLSIMDAGNDGSGNDTIKDDLTSTTLTDSNVGIYAIGRSNSGGYSRFTTSQHAANWGIAALGTTGSPSSAACSSSTVGSLFSNTSPGTTGTTLWVCTKGSSPAWGVIK
jgi:hypothetical protein